MSRAMVQGRSSVLVAPGKPGNVVGIDPHKHRLTALVLDERGGVLGCEHFRVSGGGHRALEAWARQFGPIARWGVEGAAGWGRHTAMYLVAHDHDVRDVCPARTARSDRPRQRGKSDVLDCERIARETLAHPLLPRAFKRAGQDRAPDQTHEQLSLWHSHRRSIVRMRQHLLSEAEFLLDGLALEVREQLPVTQAVMPRLTAASRLCPRTVDAVSELRLRLLADCYQHVCQLDAQEHTAVRQLKTLIAATGSSLDELCGLSTRLTAEVLVEVGDVRRFTEGGFARFNASAPLAASTAEGPHEPTRHRLNPGGNRRLNHVLHIMAVTQLRCDPRAQLIYQNARTRGHTKKEARRILKRHLSDVIYRRMIRDLHQGLT